MKIGLVDVDSHNFPNIPLMKICGGGIMDNKLKPCPFCGGKPKVISKQKNFLGWRGNGTRAIEYCIYVKCNSCHSRGKPIKTKDFDNILERNRRDFKSEVLSYVEQAIESWNRRVDDGRED